MSTYKIGFEQLGIDLDLVRRNTSTCPECSHSRKKKSQKCLSLNLTSGSYNCNHCGFKGRVDSDEWILKQRGLQQDEIHEIVKATEGELKRIMEHNNTDHFEDVVIEHEPINKKLIDWFWNERRISEATLTACGVGQKGDNTIAFNYYKEGVLLNAKYRTLDKKFWSAADVHNKDKHLYGIDNLNDSNTAYIVEGEIDALSLYECGLKNVVSLTMGATTPSKDSKWKEGEDIPSEVLKSGKLVDVINDLKVLKGMKRIILALDNDIAGKYTTQMLLQVLGKNRCLIVDWGESCKDANEVLVKFGVDEVKNYIGAARHLPIDGVVECEDVYSKIMYNRKYGHKKGIKVGIPEIDDHFSFVKGWWNLFTGIPNSGKSVFMMYIMCVMSVRHGWKWAIFSAEHYPAEDFYQELMEMLSHKPLKQLTEDETLALAVFIQKHFFFIYFDAEKGGNTLDNVLGAIAKKVILEDIDGFLIDPYNQLDMSLDEMGMRDDKYLQRALTKVDTFCKRFDVCGNIIAHPTKMYKTEGEQDYTCPTVYNVSGGAMWVNKSYIIAAIHRPFNQSDREAKEVDFNVQKVKSYKRAGSPENCNLHYLNGWYVGVGQTESDSPLYSFMDELSGIELAPYTDEELDDVPF